MALSRLTRNASVAVVACLASVGFSNVAQAQCPADIDESGMVDGADLGYLLNAWNTSDPAADLNSDGIVDGADLGNILRSWGDCLGYPRTYGATFPVALMLSTSSGPRSTVGELNLEFYCITSPNDGTVLMGVRTATFSLSSVDIGDTETGGIDLQVVDQEATAVVSPTGEFDLPISFKAHYWLIDQFYPPTGTNCVEDEAEQSSGFTQLEDWDGVLTGSVLEVPGFANVNFSFQVSTQKSWSQAAMAGAIGGAVGAALGKQYPGLDACNAPKVKTNKRTVCIQPVFIGTGADDATKTGASYADFKAKADTTWAKCCVELDWKAPKYVNKPEYKTLKLKAEGDAWADHRKLLAEEDGKGENECLEVFFVTHLQNTEGKNNDSGDGMSFGSGTKGAQIIVADDATASCDPKADGVLAHELGHGMGDCKHPEQKAAATGTCMTGTGKAPPACPGLNNTNVKTVQCEKVHKGPLVKEKNPKTPCCTDPLAP